MIDRTVLSSLVRLVPPGAQPPSPALTQISSAPESRSSASHLLISTSHPPFSLASLTHALNSVNDLS